MAAVLLFFDGKMAKEWAKAFYNSKAWRECRDTQLKMDRYRCTRPGCFEPAQEVHHIIELTPDNINDISISMNHNNLTSLCSECHKRITKEQKMKYKFKEHLQRNIVFDANGYPIEVPPVS